jgi:hypothetical protein
MKVKDMIDQAENLIFNAAMQRAWEGSAYDQEPDEAIADILLEIGYRHGLCGKLAFGEPNIFIAYASQDEIAVQALVKLHGPIAMTNFDLLKTPHHGPA